MAETQNAQLAVIIPANNEAAYIGGCLDALLFRSADARISIVVSANMCADNTVEIAQSYASAFEGRGDRLVVIDSPISGKTAALTRAESHLDVVGAGALPRAYLDADVICSPDLITQIASALDTSKPRYATGVLRVKPARSRVTRAYARFWQEVPFVKGGAVGAGFFAVNSAGRARWGCFPDIISDDTYVRLHFAPAERIEVEAPYDWPMIEGLSALVRVRRRQDAGVREIAQRYSHLMANEGKVRLGLGRFLTMAAKMPLACAVYVFVHVLTRMGRNSETWSRGR